MKKVDRERNLGREGEDKEGRGLIKMVGLIGVFGVLYMVIRSNKLGDWLILELIIDLSS